jgi:transcriptional regulator with XRE-family HTH domain
MIGTSRRHLMRLERGENRPRQALIDRIAEVTGHDVEYFADEDDEEADPAVRQAFHLFVDLVGQINSKTVNPKPAASPLAGKRDGLQTKGV